MSVNSPAVSLAVSTEALVPLIRQVIEETVVRLESIRASLPTDRLAYSEPEAAGLLGLHPHQLRDERRRGKIIASQIVGRRVRYQRADLVAYLMGGRTDSLHDTKETANERSRHQFARRRAHH